MFRPREVLTTADDGTRLQGRVEWNEDWRLLVVRLVEPYPGLHATVGDVPWFVRGLVRYVLDEQLTPSGLRAVEDRLRELFTACQLVLGDRRAVEEALERIRREVALECARSDALDPAAARAEQRVLCRQLRREGLDHRVYDRELQVLRRRAVAYREPASLVLGRLYRELEARWDRPVTCLSQGLAAAGLVC